MLTAQYRVTLEKRLDQARKAYHDLMTGEMARVFVDQNGERLEYQAANSQKLAAYIAELEMTLGLSGRAGRPMGIYL